ncbi:restriction endonuclease subunit S [Zoogloea sp.]|uniref:restriction endonuclease subunit S n=1 Tax=Zoogloea sp. TaxID=49181 RepID=UPI0035B00015
MNAVSPVETLVTDHLDLWTTALKRKSNAGRGSSSKVELYGIRKLRELILELAVRGLLVPQDPNDEPAGELLKKIAAEKARLVKEGEIKKEKPSPPIAEYEKPFELPSGWAWSRWTNIAKKIGDIDHKMPNEEPDGIPYVSPRDFHPKNIIDFSRAKKISQSDFEKLAAKIQPRRGDIIFPRYGTIGENVLVESDIDFLASYSCCVIKTLKGYISAKYQFFYSISAFVNQQCRMAENKTTQPNVGIKSIQEFVVPLPPLAEQHRIVAKVDELMVLCDQLEQETEASLGAHQTLVETLLSALTSAADHAQFASAWQRIAGNFDTLFTTEESIDQLKQTILQLAVMGKLVPQDPNDEPASELLKKIAAEKAKLVKEGKIKKEKPLPPIESEEKIFELPTGWSYCRLDEICLGVTSGSTPPQSEFSETSGVPYLKVYNIRNQAVDFEYKRQFISEQYSATKLKKSILYPGDVVMNIVGPPLGKTAIIPSNYPQWNCNQAIVFFRPVFLSLGNFIYTYLKAGLFLKNIELIGTAGQENISVTKSRSIALPMPPLNEQHRIVAKVDELIALCDQLKSRLSDAQTTQLHLADALAEQAIG